jgi:hypothetical protein
MKPGKYIHYKGGLYKVIGTAIHSETGEELVVYKSLSDNKLWVRPKVMFLEKVNLGDKQISRFKYIGG